MIMKKHVISEGVRKYTAKVAALIIYIIYIMENNMENNLIKERNWTPISPVFVKELSETTSPITIAF